MELLNIAEGGHSCPGSAPGSVACWRCDSTISRGLSAVPFKISVKEGTLKRTHKRPRWDQSIIDVPIVKVGNPVKEDTPPKVACSKCKCKKCKEYKEMLLLVVDHLGRKMGLAQVK